MLKRIGFLLLLLGVASIIFILTALNTAKVDLDLAFFAGSYQLSVVLIVAFVFGTLFGMICTTAFVFRLINERRALRRALRLSESEVSSLRSLPLSDAD